MINHSGDRISRLLEELQKCYQNLINYRTTISWKASQTNVRGAETLAFDDSHWQAVTLPMQWDPGKGDIWLRGSFVIPKQIQGIDLSDTRTELRSSVVITGTEVYVDSKLVLREEHWADFRGPSVLISEKSKPGERHLVVIHEFETRPFAKGEMEGIPSMSLFHEAVEKVAFEIDSFVQEIKFAVALPEGKVLCDRVADQFDSTVFSRGIADLIAEIGRARAKLSVLSRQAKEFKVHLIAHAHIDMNWLWPWKETVEVCRRDFSTIVSLMDRYPDLRFSQSQAVTYKAMEDNYPEVFDGIGRKVRSGNWDITASMWVEPDLNMIGTEALIRQVIHAKRYVMQKFGFEPRVCWEPDTFGHIWTLPQVLAKSGLIGYYFTRCGRGQPMFWWEGPDGSRVLAFNSVYNNAVTPSNVVETARTFYEKYGMKTSMFVYGVGDHGGGPTVEDINNTHEMQKKPTLPTLEFSSTHAFFDEVSRLDPHLPVIKDELNFTFDGCYTTHADIKHYNRLCERWLLDAERFAAIVGRYPREALLSAWRKTLFNQFHDILDGSGFRDTYPYSDSLAEEVLSTAKKTLSDSLEALARDVKFTKSAPAIVVFNSLPWDRKDVVRVAVPEELIPKNPTVIGAEANERPAQIDEDSLVFIADVPSLGYATYYLVEGTEAKQVNVADQLTMENEFIRVELDGNSGGIRTIYDKENARSVMRSQRDDGTRPVPSNLLQVLYEAPHDMSAWIIGNVTRVENCVSGAQVRLVKRGPIMTKVNAAQRYRDSLIDQDIILYSGIRRIDFRTRIDWKEVASAEGEAPMLKVSFLPILGDSRATFEIPFGSIVRVADGREVPALRWIDLSESEYGVSLLNDSKHGFDVKGNTLRMTLLRTSYNPDPAPDRGHHEFLYSLYPHAGDWKSALTFRRGYEINHPLQAVLIARHQTQTGSNPEGASFVRVEPDNVVLSCLKLAEDSDDLILRVYDATGGGADARVTFGFDVKRAEEVDLTERRIADINVTSGRIKLALGPSEIRTIKVKRN